MSLKIFTRGSAGRHWEWVLLFINVVLKMSHKMFGTEFVHKVFNTGEMKEWIDVGQMIPSEPLDRTLVEAFLDDTPPMWDLMAFTIAFNRHQQAPSADARNLVIQGVELLNAAHNHPFFLYDG